jgi:HTH-type transcriptional regulator/antitoxin HigA
MATAERVPAEIFPPGEFIQEELKERGWTQSDLAEIMGRDTALVSALVTGKRSISPETARGLGAAFGTGAALWMNLEASYQLSKVDRDDAIARRSGLYSRAPIQQMVRRGWIRKTNNIVELEVDFQRFYKLRSLEREPDKLAHAARKSSSYNDVSPEELAWLYRVVQMARLIDCPKLSMRRLNEAFKKLQQLLASPEEIRKIPSILREAGVRFMVVEKLPKTKTDGACYWLNGSSPVVILTLRYDRIDWFWHTLMHELEHVRQHDDGVVDSEIDQSIGEDDRPEAELRADEAATSFLVPQDELQDFILRVQPFFSKTKIRGFAGRIGVHPGLIVGQLQHRGHISYAHNREMLVKVRDLITTTALTDGWGDVAPAA